MTWFPAKTLPVNTMTQELELPSMNVGTQVFSAFHRAYCGLIATHPHEASSLYSCLWIWQMQMMVADHAANNIQPRICLHVGDLFLGFKDRQSCQLLSDSCTFVAALFWWTGSFICWFTLQMAGSMAVVYLYTLHSQGCARKLQFIQGGKRHHLLPPRIHINREVESDAELGLESIAWTWDAGLLSRVLTFTANTCSW